MLGVYGDTLANSVFMTSNLNANANSGKGKEKRSPLVIEFFPDGKFINENEFVTRSVGIEYVAWRNTKRVFFYSPFYNWLLMIA